MTHRSDSGAITLGRLIAIGAVMLLVCLLFLLIDVRHRMTGYKTVNDGIMGAARVTECEWHKLGSFCTGDFTSADGKVMRSEVRINGAAELLDWDRSQGAATPSEPVTVSAAISDQKADEAWTTEGTPWLHLSPLSGLALSPMVLLLLFGRAFTRAGTYDWWMRIDHARGARIRGVQRREGLLQMRVRRKTH